MALPLATFAAPTRPLLLVFASGDSDALGVEVKKDGEDLSRTERATVAARTVRNLLNESGAVAASLYQPEGSLFLRAVKEANITLINRDNPTDRERVAIGKGAGAVYVVAVTAQPARSGSGIEIALHGTDLETGKTWDEKSNATTGTVGLGPSDPNAVRSVTVTGGGTTGADNALMSAANTLVTRLLVGPLAAFSRPTPPAALLPPIPATRTPEPPPLVASAPPSPRSASGAATEMTSRSTRPDPVAAATATRIKSPVPNPAPPPTSAVSPVSDADTAAADLALSLSATRREAESLLAGGDNNAAIVMLRRAINQSPGAMPLRILLTRAYLAARRGNDAAGEAQRALTLNPPSDRPSELELTRLLAQAFALNGDTTGARFTYEQIIASQPQAHWAQILLANLLLGQNKPIEAESLFRAVKQAEPSNREAALGLARLFADRNDYSAAQRELLSLQGQRGNDNAAAYATTVEFFDERIIRLGSLMDANRGAWEKGTLSRETLYKATSAQNSRVAGLLALLKAAAPLVGSPSPVLRAYKGRVYAASLLAQSVASLLAFLDNGDADSGSKASVQLIEFQREMDSARRTDASAL